MKLASFDIKNSWLGWTAGVVGVLFALITQGPVVWNVVGWVTPAAYAEDQAQDALEKAEIAAMQAAIEAAILAKLDENHDAWKCDEYDEELEEKLQKIVEGDTTVETSERVERLRELRTRRDCSRFDE